MKKYTLNELDRLFRNMIYETKKEPNVNEFLEWINKMSAEGKIEALLSRYIIER